MSLMAAPRPLYSHNTPSENGKAMEKETTSILHYFSPFSLGSFPLRALRRLALAFNSLSFKSAASFHIPVPSMSMRLKKNDNNTEEISLKTQPRLPLLWFPRFGRSVKEINEVQLRRDLALERSVDDQETERRVVPFVNSRGQTLFTQSWTPSNPGTIMKGLVVLLHGLNEHSGRYAPFAVQLNSQGFGVFGMDWIGHGGSDGLHGYVESLDHVVADAKEFLQRVTAEYPGLPCFLFGHSTGGAIALKVLGQAASQADLEKALEGVVLTSPAVRVKPAHPVIGAVAPLFSVLLPRYQFRGANRKLAVCRDPAALVAKYTDPLVYTGPIRIRTGTEILRLSSYLLKNLKSVTVPLFVLHGSDDQVTDPKGSQELYDQAASRYKNIKIYNGLLHDILFEPEREEITQDIVNWLDERLGQIDSSYESASDSF